MWRCNFTKEKKQQQTKNIVKLKPFELQVEDENEGLEGAQKKRWRGVWLNTNILSQPAH